MLCGLGGWESGELGKVGLVFYMVLGLSYMGWMKAGSQSDYGEKYETGIRVRFLYMDFGIR